MSDGLPTDEQLRRIARGVHERIDRRRRIVGGIAGTTAGVLLLAGGVALLPHAGASSAGSATSGQDQAGSSAGVKVRCRIGEPRTVTAPDDPVQAAAACGAVDFQVGEGRVPSAASAPAPSQAASAAPSRAVVCRAEDGALVVLPAGDEPASTCARSGLQPY